MTPQQQSIRKKIIRQIARLMMKYVISYAEITQAWHEVATEKAREDYERTQLQNIEHAKHN